MNRRMCLSCLAVVLSAGAVNAATLYVDANLTTGLNNGNSWADAYQGAGGLQTAILAANAGDEIWVARGRYVPSTTGDRNASFFPRTGIAVYGGFAGGETVVVQRNVSANVTILSGDLQGNSGSGVFTDDSFHVVYAAGAAHNGIIDGFTITHGNANGSSANDTDRGGGMIILTGANPTFRYCRVVQNRCVFGGGAGYVRTASPRFEDCVFESNFGASFGGGFDTFTGAICTWVRCSFIGNTAARASAVEAFGSCTANLINCVIRNNATNGANGGAILVASSSVANIVNCTIVNNTSAGATPGGIFSSGSTVSISNSILFGNTVAQITGPATATYSLIQGGFAGAGNISATPIFYNSAGGDLRLAANSPGIDAGDNTALPVGTVTDIRDFPRLVNDLTVPDTGVGSPPIVDMGAYERQECRADVTGDGQINFGDLNVVLSNFGQNVAPGTNGDATGDGVVNFADLNLVLSGFGRPC